MNNTTAFLLVVILLLVIVAGVALWDQHRKCSAAILAESKLHTEAIARHAKASQRQEWRHESLNKAYQTLLAKHESSLRQQAREIKAARADAVKRSKAVQHGFTSENLAPLVQSRWNPDDFRHMGDPVDFIVFANHHKFRGSKAEIIEEVVLLDVKTGNSQLNKVQRRIRDAVQQGRVRFAVYNLDKQQLRCWPADGPSPQLQLPIKVKKQ